MDDPHLVTVMLGRKLHALPAKQNTAEDWKLGSLGCYDAASLARLQTTLRLDFGAVARGNLAACLARPLDASIQRALCDETRRACPDALSHLMADHTQVRRTYQVHML